ncbi:aldose epimerase family protein [Chthonobacter rhizosphaerae]|uniref:aldose epimerase family protein n=1 Tax=Chthonobacter rhizosphaerae TaxID=2735553 RepID=UPI0015EEE40F|nr:aldose epimerase family protein [Chthonobacter rhizosphaerae]
MSDVRPFGTLPDGRAVHEIRLVGDGIRASVLTYGAILRDLEVETATGWRRVVLGYPRLEDYLAYSNYFGCVAGRCANRIRDGRFTLDGVEHQLSLNEKGRTHLHGGVEGFDQRLWTLDGANPSEVRLTLVSPDGDQGYPGTLTAAATYRLADRTAHLEFSAATDRPTLVNLAGHSYFDLDDAGDIRRHEVMIPAERYTPVDADLIPTGELAPVAGTPFDFRHPRPFHAPGLSASYDHNFAIADTIAPEPRLMARVRGPRTGLVLEVHSTEPGLQVYDGNMIDTKAASLSGRVPQTHDGFCLEPQRFPDAPHHPQFPSVVLRPGETYRQHTLYRFILPETAGPTG